MSDNTKDKEEAKKLLGLMDMHDAIDSLKLAVSRGEKAHFYIEHVPSLKPGYYTGDLIGDVATVCDGLSVVILLTGMFRVVPETYDDRLALRIVNPYFGGEKEYLKIKALIANSPMPWDRGAQEAPRSVSGNVPPNETL